MSDSPQYLVVARHGQSKANVAVQQGGDELYYEITGSDREVPLTDLGVSQCRWLGRLLGWLFSAEVPIRRVWVSAFRRVSQSADCIEQELGYKPERSVDCRLDKRHYGDFWNLTYKGIEVLYPEEHARYLELGPLNYRPPRGENYPDVFARVDEFIAEVVDPSRENMLVVTSSVVVLSFQRALEGLPDEEVERRYEASAIPNGSVLIYCRRGPQDRWRRLV